MFLFPVLTIIYSVVAVSLYLKYEELKSKEEGIKIRSDSLREREEQQFNKTEYDGCFVCKEFLDHEGNNITCLVHEITKFTELLQDPKVSKKVENALSKEDQSTHLLCLKDNILRIYKNESSAEITKCHKALRKFRKSTWKAFRNLLDDIKKI